MLPCAGRPALVVQPLTLAPPQLEIPPNFPPESFADLGGMHHAHPISRRSSLASSAAPSLHSQILAAPRMIESRAPFHAALRPPPEEGLDTSGGTLPQDATADATNPQAGETKDTPAVDKADAAAVEGVPEPLDKDKTVRLPTLCHSRKRPDPAWRRCSRSLWQCPAAESCRTLGTACWESLLPI